MNHRLGTNKKFTITIKKNNATFDITGLSGNFSLFDETNLLIDSRSISIEDGPNGVLSVSYTTVDTFEPKPYRFSLVLNDEHIQSGFFIISNLPDYV